MHNFVYNIPTKVYFGEGQLEGNLGKELAREVTDSGLTLEEFLCIDSAYKY